MKKNAVRFVANSIFFDVGSHSLKLFFVSPFGTDRLPTTAACATHPAVHQPQHQRR